MTKFSKKQKEAARKFVLNSIFEITISQERLAELLGVEPFKTDEEYYSALSPVLGLLGRANAEVKRARIA
jgi:hypothetical protein